MSFPVLIAVTDSKQPVVEKVQQLPQLPFSAKTNKKKNKKAICETKTATILERNYNSRSKQKLTKSHANFCVQICL